MAVSAVLDSAGRRRSPATMPATTPLARARAAAGRPLLCLIDGRTGGPGLPPGSGPSRGLAARAGVRRRFAPHQLRHAER
jgi:hypothetical protein